MSENMTSTSKQTIQKDEKGAECVRRPIRFFKQFYYYHSLGNSKFLPFFVIFRHHPLDNIKPFGNSDNIVALSFLLNI